MALCVWFLGFLASSTFFSPVSDFVEQRDINQLAFHASDIDSHSAFTRQAADGELDVPDPDARTSGKIISEGILLQSSTLSSSVPVRQNQISVVRIPTGSRTLLYHRLII